MRTPSKSERIINCTFSVLFLTCLFRTLFSGLFKKFVGACFKQVFIDGKTCENCFFVLFSWSLNIYAREVGIWGGLRKTLTSYLRGGFFFYFYQKRVLSHKFWGFILSNLRYILRNFGLLNFRSIYNAYFHNTYLISSCCLINWRIFLPASKATDR